MNLHFDSSSFEELIIRINESTGVRQDILEKDYYVTLMLKELAKNQGYWYAYFKGGTALYKALGSIRRFSEDIDLTVDIKECSNSQAKKRLENSARGYRSLERIPEESDNRKGSITEVYKYNSIVPFDTDDMLQRFGRVKVESTSFTVSEPVQSMRISPILYDYSDRETKEILTQNFEVSPFDVLTIRLERIFVDKLFAAQFYYERGMYFDVAKHIYDIAILTPNDTIKRLLADKNYLCEVINYKRIEETHRTGGVSAELLIKDFNYLDNLKNNKAFLTDFSKMQTQYVFNPEDIIDLISVTETLSYIKDMCIKYDI